MTSKFLIRVGTDSRNRHVSRTQNTKMTVDKLGERLERDETTLNDKYPIVVAPGPVSASGMDYTLFDTLSHKLTQALMTSSRDMAHDYMHQSIVKCLRELDVGHVQIALPTFVNDVDPSDVSKDWRACDISGEFGALQKDITDKHGAMTRSMHTMSGLSRELAVQHDSVVHVIGSIITTLNTRMSLFRDEYTARKTAYANFREARRSALVSLWEMLLSTMSTFSQELTKISREYRNFVKSIDSSNVTINDPFTTQWKNLADSYKHWLRAIHPYVPSTVRMMADASRIVDLDDTRGDECCTRRVGIIRDHLERIGSVIAIETALIPECDVPAGDTRNTRLWTISDQVNTWRSRITAFEKVVAAEVDCWDAKHGHVHKKHAILRDETVRTLERLYVTSIDQIDKMGAAITQTASVHIRGYASALANHVSNTRVNLQTTTSSLAVYERRVAMSSKFAPVFQSYRLSEDPWRISQERSFVLFMTAETLSACSKLMGEHQLWLKRFP